MYNAHKQLTNPLAFVRETIASVIFGSAYPGLVHLSLGMKLKKHKNFRQRNMNGIKFAKSKIADGQMLRRFGSYLNRFI